MTDDTAALQNAENAGDVCFPSGYTFLINSPPVRINTANRHWQAGMTGGAAPVIKNTNSTTGNAMVYVYSNNFSVIGLDFEGANTIPPQWNPNHGSQEWNDAIEIESAGYGLYAGNTFNEWFGDTEIIDYGGSTCGTGHNTIEYNTFKNCGLYGPANDAVMNDTFAHNTMTDCSDGQENDNSSQCAGGSVWNQESVTCYYGMGYQSSMGICAYLTGGSAANGNYSGNTVENSSVSGSANTGYPSSLYKYATGGTSDQATYTNDSCTNGCVVH